MGMRLRVKTVGPWQMNAYALVCPASRRSVLIDPGDEPRELDALLEGTHPVAIAVIEAKADARITADNLVWHNFHSEHRAWSSSRKNALSSIGRRPG